MCAKAPLLMFLNEMGPFYHFHKTIVNYCTFNHVKCFRIYVNVFNLNKT